MKVKIKKFINRFVKEESGQSLIEYVILAALLIIGIIAVIGLLGDKIKKKFNDVVKALGS
jgi:Flp pilus assembly pilin Flp